MTYAASSFGWKRRKREASTRRVSDLSLRGEGVDDFWITEPRWRMPFWKLWSASPSTRTGSHDGRRHCLFTDSCARSDTSSTTDTSARPTSMSASGSGLSRWLECVGIGHSSREIPAPAIASAAISSASDESEQIELSRHRAGLLGLLSRSGSEAMPLTFEEQLTFDMAPLCKPPLLAPLLLRFCAPQKLCAPQEPPGGTCSTG